MRALALLSAVAITASLAVAVPGSVAESTALASTTECVDAHPPVAPVETSAGSNIYNIESAANLVYLSVNQDSGTPKWRTRNFVQTASVDLDGCLWMPIGADGADFTGEYDGGGFPIHNLTIPSGTYSGLFGSTDGATITGVHLLDADLNQAGSFSGTLVGQALDTTISDSSATGSISATGNNVGGLVGVAFDSTTISRSFSTVTVTRASGSDLAYGGLVGDLRGSSIESSFATGAVSAGDRTGGLAGSVGETSTISNSYARGPVTGDDKVGGLIGALLLSANLTVTNSYATGKVSKVEGTTGKLGGLIGGKFDSVTLTVTNSFWDKDTTEQNATLDDKGSGQTTTNMKSLSTFSDWPIVEGWQSFDPANNRVWGIRSDLNDGYPFLLWEYKTDPEFSCGPLAGDGFHLISTVDQLTSVGIGGSNSPCGLGDKYRQTNAIDLADTEPWTPIGADGAAFTGEYDGGGFAIDNLTIPSGDSRGLFGFTDSATITGVHLLNANLQVGENSGTLAGQAFGTTISDSSATGSISSTGNSVGGLVGFANESTIIRSSSTVSVEGDGADYGGLVGTLEESTIDSSFATGAVSTVANGGGLVAQVQNTSSISNSYARGAVTGANGAGGLIGFLGNPANLELSNSYATGKVVSTAGEIGGLIGGKATGATLTVTNSFWDKNTTEQDDSLDNQGSGETTAAMKTLSTFSGAGWSIASCRTTGEDTVWGIVPGGYPFLTWQDTPQLSACTTTTQQSSPSTRPRPTPDPTALEPVTPVAPQQFGGASTDVVDDADRESTLEVPVAVDEATDPDAEGAGGDPAVAGSDSDTEALGIGQASGNSAWLWAIGLGGLGAVGLIAGGVAFARLRP